MNSWAGSVKANTTTATIPGKASGIDDADEGGEPAVAVDHGLFLDVGRDRP